MASSKASILLLKVCQRIADTAAYFFVDGRLAKMPSGLQSFDGPVQKISREFLVYEDVTGMGCANYGLSGVAVGVEDLDGSHDFCSMAGWPGKK